MSEAQTFLQLCDLADITMGQSPDSANCNTDERGLPFLQGCAEFGKQSPSTEVYCHQPLRASKPDSILMSVRAPVGKLNWGEQGYCLGRGLGAIKAKLGISDTRFLGYSIEQNVAFLHRRSQGSTFSAIGTNDIKIFPIPKVPYEKQKKISFILGTIDLAIEKTEALIEKYQQIKAGLMHNLFTRGISADGQLRPPREQAPELYQHTPIGWIPKEWDVKPLATLTSKIVDGVHHTPRYVEHGVPFVTVKNLTGSETIDFTSLNYIDEKTHRDCYSRADPKPGDVLVTKDGTLGVCRIVREGMPEFSIFVSVALLRVTDELTSEWLHFFFESGEYLKQLGHLSSGTGLKHIHLEHFRKFQIALPERCEQKWINDKVKIAEEKIGSEQKLLSKLIKQKLGLMHDLLTGKVRVKLDSQTSEMAGG